MMQPKALDQVESDSGESFSSLTRNTRADDDAVAAVHDGAVGRPPHELLPFPAADGPAGATRNPAANANPKPYFFFFITLKPRVE